MISLHPLPHQYPSWITATHAYATAFNSAAQELGVVVRMVTEGREQKAHPLRVNWERPLVKGPTFGSHSIDKRDLKNGEATRQVHRVVQEIERRRQVMVNAGLNIFPVVRSATYVDDKLAMLNPAERSWLEAVKGPLFEATQAIYAVQKLSNSAETLAWMERYGDPTSHFHYRRARGNPFMTSDVTEFQHPHDFASALPWFPDQPSYSNMWPFDFSEGELSYINTRYGPGDPIRLPWTRVTRITEHEAQNIIRHPQSNRRGHKVEWARQGLAGRWYRVLNMAFDPEMRPHFLSMATALWDLAGIRVKGRGLHPEFKAYTLLAADALGEGDFLGLLESDLAQSKGNLFLTIGSHEGYGKDGIKYPFMFEVGIKDRALLSEVSQQGYVFNWLAERVACVVREAGLSGYSARTFDISALDRDAVFFWAAMTGGDMRAFARDPGGHDYPKRDFPGIDTHRTVMLLDVLKTWAPLTEAVAEALFSSEMAGVISFYGFQRFAFLHEAGHQVQIPQSSMLASGLPMSSAFGVWWGPLVEPWADAGSILAHKKLADDGKLSPDKLREVVMSGLVYNVVRLRPRAQIFTPEMMQGGPHITGASMFLGWLWQGGAFQHNDGQFSFVDHLLFGETGRFFDALTTQATRGNRADFEEFARTAVGWLPPEVESEILERKAAVASYTLLDRGELNPPT